MMYETNQIVVISLDQLVPNDHFLRRLAELFPWEKWAKPFEKSFKGEKEYGPHGYAVSALLKMTVLSYLYDLSDPQTETYVRENNPARYFLGLGLLDPVPDETTICRFRGRIITKKMGKALSDLFDRVLVHTQKLGIKMGHVQILDSVHTESKINPNKEKAKNKKLEEKGKKPEPPRDPDATWGCKGQRKEKDPESGEIKVHKKYFYGYKTHASLNQKTGFVTSLLISTGKDADSPASRFLLRSDLAKGLKVTVVTADKAYDDLDLYVFCGKHEIFPAIALKKTRLEQKSEKNRKKWEDHKKAPFYKKALGMRYKIEQKFGEGKNSHGLRECRYRGLLKFMFQSAFTFLSMNLKRILKLVPVRKMQLCGG